MLSRVSDNSQFNSSRNFSNPRKDSNRRNEIPAIVKLIIQTGKDKSSRAPTSQEINQTKQIHEIYTRTSIKIKTKTNLHQFCTELYGMHGFSLVEAAHNHLQANS